jgi:hypothetical protein
LSGGIAAEGELGLAANPIENSPQRSGQAGEVLGAQAAAARQALAAAYAGPEAAVGEAVVRLGPVKMLRQLVPRDVAHEADVCSGGLEGMMAIKGAQIACVPGAAEQGRQMAFLPSENLEHGSELLCQDEQAPIGGLLLTARGLVTQGMDEAVGGQAGGGHSALDPEIVHFGEEAGDLTPAGSLTCLARFAYQHDEEVEAVAGEPDHAVRRRPDQVAEGGEKLQKDGGRIGF